MKFLVDSVDRSGRILGRNIEDKDIPVGSTFTEITKTQRGGDAQNSMSTDLGVASINLKLKHVEFFRRSIEVIPFGHSAGLLVEGQGIDTLISVLENCKEKESIYIVLQ